MFCTNFPLKEDVVFELERGIKGLAVADLRKTKNCGQGRLASPTSTRIPALCLTDKMRERDFQPLQGTPGISGPPIKPWESHRLSFLHGLLLFGV